MNPCLQVHGLLCDIRVSIVLHQTVCVCIIPFLQDLGVYAGCIVFVALLNSCGLKVLTLCTQLGGMFHLAGIVLLALIVPLMATQHQPASFVFGFYEKEHAEEVGIVNPL